MEGLELYATRELIDELLNRESVEIIIVWQLTNNLGKGDIMRNHTRTMDQQTYATFIEEMREY